MKATLVEEMPAPCRGGAADIQSEKEKKPAGEDRPLEATGPTDVFFGLKPMSLSVSAEGRLEVRPVRCHWGTPAGKCRECPVHDAVGRRGGACAGWRSS